MKLRKRAMLIIPATAGLLLAVGVGPASASTNYHANCVAENAVGGNEFGQEIGYPGFGGRVETKYSAPENDTAHYYCF